MTDVIKKMVDKIMDQNKLKRESEMYSLGDLIKELKNFNPDAHVGIPPFNLYPTGFDSYRGYYEDLAISYEATDYSNHITVADFIKLAEECIGKTYTGWKGGEFTMSEKTLLWIGNTGETTGLGIVGLVDPYENSSPGGYVDIITKQEG
ncbi:MAG: hypothetical protein ACTSP4_00830 [Candidatus Hodarchaeales archaeon]